MRKLFTAAFQMYPKTQKETEKDAWVECVKAIDVVNRALNCKRITSRSWQMYVSTSANFSNFWELQRFLFTTNSCT